METIEIENDCVEIIHKKTDDFYVVFEAFKEGTDEEFDTDGLAFALEISDSYNVILTINGAVIGNELEFSEPAASFADMTFLAKYMHRLVETTTNTTLFEGHFKFK